MRRALEAGGIHLTFSHDGQATGIATGPEPMDVIRNGRL